MFEFYPKRLTEALEKVRKTHTSVKGDAPDIGKSVVDEVREILSRFEIKDLNNIIFQFDLRRLLACIEIVSIDREGETAEKAAYAVKMRPKEKMIPVVWFKLIKNYPHFLLEFLLRDLIREKGVKAIENHPNISNRVIRWLMDSDLTMGVLSDYRTSPHTTDFDKYLSHHFIKQQDSFYQFTWKKLLIKGAAADIRRQSPQRILGIIENEIQSSLAIQMGQHYLNMLRGRAIWDESILKFINHKWGRPIIDYTTTDAESRFWEGVSVEAKKEFHKWLMLREIDDFFEGERANFWRMYVEKGFIMTVEKILEGKGFILTFSDFGVIEFKDKGNAAYTYPLNVVNEYRRNSRFRNFVAGDYKSLKRTARLKSMPLWDGRIIHRDGWQELTAHKIDMMMAEL